MKTLLFGVIILGCNILRRLASYTNGKIVLPSGFTVKSTFKGLKKAWLGFKIAKSRDDNDKMIYYAKIIQKLQEELPVSNFINIDMPIRSELHDEN